MLDLHVAIPHKGIRLHGVILALALGLQYIHPRFSLLTHGVEGLQKLLAGLGIGNAPPYMDAIQEFAKGRFPVRHYLGAINSDMQGFVDRVVVDCDDSAAVE